jgi:bifunctional UDP-N-acetylglucosamine pyrophosphorylase/glucosamine-1-phosphate N-acetyltransferase
VILAAGEGSRLHPFTMSRPKHLIPIGGKPLLEHVLLSIKQAGLEEVLIVVHHMSERLKSYFGDGSRLGLKLEYAYQSEIKGTADAACFAKTFVDEEFLLIYGDLYIAYNTIENVIGAHKVSENAVTMSVVQVDNPEQYGIVELDGTKVISIIEKPDSERIKSNLANAGIYIFKSDLFETLEQTPISPRGEKEITDSIRIIIKDTNDVGAVQLSTKEWIDVGRPWDILDANGLNLLLLDKSKIDGHVEDNVHLLGSVVIGRKTRIRSGAYIEGPVFIDEECDIGPNCYLRPNTSVGKRVRIGNSCEIKNSVIMEGTAIGHLSYIGDSVIGETCNLGSGTIAANYRFDGETICMRLKNKIVDSRKNKLGVFMGDGVRTGINTSIMPGVKIGPRSWIGPNIVLDRDISSDAILFLEQTIIERKPEKNQK